MDLGKIKWCLRQNQGIRLIEPSPNLANSYLSMATDSLSVMANEKNRSIRWAISSGYYSMYYSLYAVLMKIGIKSEIHSCTISFMKSFLSRDYTESDIALIEKASNTRNIIQYYVERSVDLKDAEEIFNNAVKFFNKSKEILSNLNEDNIKEIRNNLKNLMRDVP